MIRESLLRHDSRYARYVTYKRKKEIIEWITNKTIATQKKAKSLSDTLLLAQHLKSKMYGKSIEFIWRASKNTKIT